MQQQKKEEKLDARMKSPGLGERKRKRETGREEKKDGMQDIAAPRDTRRRVISTTS